MQCTVGNWWIIGLVCFVSFIFIFTPVFGTLAYCILSCYRPHCENSNFEYLVKFYPIYNDAGQM